MTDIEPVPAATVVLIRENVGSKNLKCFWCSEIRGWCSMEGTGSSPVAGWMMRILAMMNREDWNIPPRFMQRSGNP